MTTEAPGAERGTRNADEPPETAQHTQTSARVRERAILILRWLRGFLADQGRSVRDSGPLDYRPSSIRQVWQRTTQGGWIPGDHPWWVELPGYAFGFLVAVPATVLLAPQLYVLQRLGRTKVGAIFCVLLVATRVAYIVWFPLWLVGHVLLFVVHLLGGWS
jgi:hypothetical protein